MSNLATQLKVASNGVAKASSNETNVVAATGLTLRVGILGASLLPGAGTNRTIFDIGDATGAGGDTHRKAAFHLRQDGAGNVEIAVLAGGTGMVSLTTFAASLIDPTKWYDLFITVRNSGTNRRQAYLWERTVVAPKLNYNLTFAGAAFSTTAGLGILSFGKVASDTLYPGMDATYDYIALYDQTAYDNYDATTGAPALPANGDAGLLSAYLLDTGAGSTTDANVKAGEPALTITNGTWVGGYGYVPGAATNIIVSQQPNTTTTTIAHTVPPIVSTVDVNGIPTPDTSNITASLVTVSGTGIIQGTLTRAAVAGVDQFTDLTVKSDAGGSFKYRFTLGALPTVDTAAFTVNPPGAPKQIICTLQPSASALTNTPLATQPRFELRDVLGAVCVNYVGNVTLSLYSGATRGTLGGTLTKAVASGVADFAGLGVKITGNGSFRIAPACVDVPVSAQFPVYSTGYVQIYSGAAATQALVYPYETEGLQVGDTKTFRAECSDASRLLTTPPGAVTYSSSDAAVATVGMSSGIVTAVGVGTATISMFTGAFTKTCVVKVLAADGVPVPPQTILATAEADTPCSATRVFTPTTLAAAQAAASSYRAGDKFILDPSFVVTGPLLFTRDPTDTSTTDWCWVTVSGAMACPEGTQQSPSATLPTILSNGTGAIMLAPYSGQIRFRGIKTDFAPATGGNNYPHIGIGDGTENTVLMMPHNVIIDRCVINNTTTTQSSRGVQPNCRRFACVDSYIAGFHAVSSYEAQAIGCWQAMGPFKIDNCYTAGSDETIATGSDAQSIPVQIADVRITRTTVDKDPLWRANGTGSIKNGIEFKKMVRAQISGCLVRNASYDGQTGQAFYTRSGDDQNDMNDVITRDVNIEYSVVQNCHQLYQFDPGYVAGEPNLRRVRVRHIVALGLGQPPTQSLGGLKSEYVAWGVLDASDGNLGPNNTVQDLTIEHITAIGYNSAFGVAVGLIQDGAGNAHQMPRFKLKNCILASYSAGAGFGPVFFVGSFTNQQWVLFGQAIAANFAGNVLPGSVTTYASEGTNYRPASLAAVGFVGGATAAIDVNATLTDLALAATSPYKGLATDGSDPGADIAAVMAALASSTTATHLGVSVQPNACVSGVPHTVQPVVTLLDLSGSIVPSETSAVTATLVVESGIATPIGTLTRPAVGGVVGFTGLGATSAAGAVAHWHFTDGALVAIDSASFTIAAAPIDPLVGVPAALVVVTPIGGVVSGQPCTQQPVYRIVDMYGTLCAASTLTATIAKVSGPGRVSNGVKTAVGGIITFTALTFVGGGTSSYVLTLSGS